MDAAENIIFDEDKKQLLLPHRDMRTLDADLINEYSWRTEYLDLSHNRISNLTWIYDFPELNYLILDCNRLREAHFKRLKQPLSRIKVLMLNKNELSDLKTTASILAFLFPNLEYLSLHGNPICPDGLELQPFSEYVPYEYEFYRSHISEALPNLKFLDHSSMQSQFVNSMPEIKTRASTFTPKILWSFFKASSPTPCEPYNPLSVSSSRFTGNHCELMRKISEGEEVYTGNNSEGNRFISSNDL